MESPPDSISLCLPYSVDLELLNQHILRRINYVLENDTSGDITIRNIKNDGLKIYQERIRPILDKYQEFIKRDKEKKVPLLNKKKLNNEELYEYNMIIEFTNIARDYINIEIIDKTERKISCPNCGKAFRKNSEKLICKKCGYEPADFNQSSSNSQTNYINSINFEKKIQMKQGKRHSNFPPDLFEKLDNHFISLGMYTGEEIRKKKHNSRGEKKGTSLDQLIDALKAIKMPKLYNDVDYIAHIYWGWTLLDFSSLESELMDMYRKTQVFYEEIKGTARRAALNTEVRLYLQLMALSDKLNFKVYRSRFRFQDSQDSLEFHQAAWRYMCEKANIKYHSII